MTKAINALVEEYLTLQESFDIGMKISDDDEELQANIKVAEEKMKQYAETLNNLLQPKIKLSEEIRGRQKAILETLKDAYDGENKTLETKAGIITYKITKITIIDDPVEVVETLRNNNKIEEGIKTFKLPFIRKLIETGLLENAAHFDEKINTKVAPPSED